VAQNKSGARSRKIGRLRRSRPLAGERGVKIKKVRSTGHVSAAKIMRGDVEHVRQPLLGGRRRALGPSGPRGDRSIPGVKTGKQAALPQGTAQHIAGPTDSGRGRWTGPDEQCESLEFLAAAVVGAEVGVHHGGSVGAGEQPERSRSRMLSTLGQAQVIGGDKEAGSLSTV